MSHIHFLVVSEVLERIMSNRVDYHLDSKDLVYEKQFGFQRNNWADIVGSFEKGQ